MRARSRRRKPAVENVADGHFGEAGDADRHARGSGRAAVPYAVDLLAAVAECCREAIPPAVADLQVAQGGADARLLLRRQVARAAHDCTAAIASPAENDGSNPCSWTARVTHQRLWQSTLIKTSFTFACDERERSAPPKLALIAPKVASTCWRLPYRANHSSRKRSDLASARDHSGDFGSMTALSFMATNGSAPQA